MRASHNTTALMCTRDGSRTIQKAIASLGSQESPNDPIKLVVVDNGSSDDTVAIARDTISKWGIDGRVLHEPKPGKINAFLVGLQACTTNLVTIVDDDNYLGQDFVRLTVDIFERHPQVGMTGSLNQVVDVPNLPHWFSWAAGRYGCGKPYLSDTVSCDKNGISIARTGVIAGAGSTFRAEPLRNALKAGYSFFNDTQRGKGMKVTGEDIELCWLYKRLGFYFGYDPRVQVKHAIHPERVTIDRFFELCRTIGAGSLGFDPYIFAATEGSSSAWYKHTWQWQLVSKIRRYIAISMKPEFPDDTSGEGRFRNRIARTECWGAIRRILAERQRYTRHIRLVQSIETHNE